MEQRIWVWFSSGLPVRKISPLILLAASVLHRGPRGLLGDFDGPGDFEGVCVKDKSPSGLFVAMSSIAMAAEFARRIFSSRCTWRTMSWIMLWRTSSNISYALGMLAV